MKTRAIMACGVLAFGLPLLTGCDKTKTSEPPVIIVEQDKVAEAFIWDSYKVLPDCEDTLKTPCITFDEGKWRKVYSYDPYAATTIKRPTKVKGGYRTK